MTIIVALSSLCNGYVTLSLFPVTNQDSSACILGKTAELETFYNLVAAIPTKPFLYSFHVYILYMYFVSLFIKAKVLCGVFL